MLYNVQEHEQILNAKGLQDMRTNVIDQRTPAMKREQAKENKRNSEAHQTLGNLYSSVLGDPFKKKEQS